MKILLIGNYKIDKQQSMQLFCDVLARGMTELGHEIRIVRPHPIAGSIAPRPHGVGKWLGYVDKFMFFPPSMRTDLKWADVAHICDHSNSFYTPHVSGIPSLVTCHDLLAVRGAMGEETDCPASYTGKVLQRWILRGLEKAKMVVCVSKSTQEDLTRLSGKQVRSTVILNGLNQSYHVLKADEVTERLFTIRGFRLEQPYILHVGSSLKRKNRDGILRIFHRIKDQWRGNLVFAGAPLTDELKALAVTLGLSGRVMQVLDPSHQQLEALYNRAFAFLFPSRFEGFGWPLIEAQACGCPVLISDRCSLPEVANGTALMRAVEDEGGFADDLISLTRRGEREKWINRGLQNTQRFSTHAMLKQYEDVYRKLTTR